MKVYLLYCDQEVLGVFSSAEKAQAFHDQNSRDEFEAEVYIYAEEVDPVEVAPEPEYMAVK